MFKRCKKFKEKLKKYEKCERSFMLKDHYEMIFSNKI